MPHATFQRGPCTPTSRAHAVSWSRAASQKGFRGLRHASKSRKLAQGNSRQTPSKVSAAAASSAEEVTTDLKQLFKDALQSDVPTAGSAATPSASQGLDTSRIPAPSNPDRGFLGQMGPTADGVNSQAGSTAQAVKSQAAPATEAVKSQAAPAAEALKTQAQSLAPSSAESASQGLQPPAPSGSVVDSAKAAGEQLQSQLKSSTDLLPSIGNGPTEAVKSVVQQANEATSTAIQSAQDAKGNLLDGINQAVPSLQSSVDSAAASFSSQVSDAASAVLDALPPPAAEALQAAASAIQPAAAAVWAYATSDPKAGATVAGLAVGLPLLSFWRARLSGYSGLLPPDKVLQLLNKSNSLLIDIRREEVRNRDGIPVLKRGSRGKGAAFPITSSAVPISSSQLRNIKQGQNFRLQVAALQILGLKQMKPGAQLVLMDRTGGADAIAVARNICQLSRRKAYVVAGGFNAWAKQGLATQETGTNYQSTVFDSLQDEAETLAESATSVLRDPLIAIGAFGGVALAGVALVDWHYALRYVGAVGAQISLINWLRSYDNPQDALSDIGSTYQKYSQKASKLTGSRSKRSDAEPMPTSDVYESDQQFLDTGDDEPQSGSKSPTSSSPSRSQKAPMSRTS